MAVQYSIEQNQIFVDNMDEYREGIKDVSPKETGKTTINCAKVLIKSNPLLGDRSVNGVAERLVYFDNLLAGVNFPHDYYLIGTYENYFNILPRKNNNKEPNKWKTQHETRKK